MKLSNLTNTIDAVWVPYEDGAELHIRRWNNPEFKQAVKRIQRPLLKGFRRGSAQAQDLMEDVQMRAAAEHVLVGWRGFEDDEGKPVDYSPEIALELFRNPSSNFYEHVVEEAVDASQFREADIEDVKGN